MNIQNIQQKTQVYFSRSYRHFKPNTKERWLFLLMCVFPCLVIYLLYYTEITYSLASWLKHVLSACIPEDFLSISNTRFLPVFGDIYYVCTPTRLPGLKETAINLLVTLFLLGINFFFPRNKKWGTPLSIYLAISLLLHLLACIYFAFAKEFFPYTATEYSQLYMLQQVSIWLSFLVLAGLITGVIGYGKIFWKVIVFIGIMAYSFVFGCVRYLVFMLVISSVSSLYMVTLFFTLGPLFDFLYLVFFYSIFINVQIKRFDHGKGRLEWIWL